MFNRQVGLSGEEQAAQYLIKQGYTVLERNFTCRGGELDIVARDPQGVLVFVEVKSRNNTRFGAPEEAITPAKVRSLLTAARYYCMQHKCFGQNMRFDVIAILRGSVRHIPNAFGLQG